MTEKDIYNIAKSNQWDDKTKQCFLTLIKQLDGFSHSEIIVIMDSLKRFIDRHSFLKS